MGKKRCLQCQLCIPIGFQNSQPDSISQHEFFFHNAAVSMFQCLCKAFTPKLFDASYNSIVGLADFGFTRPHQFLINTENKEKFKVLRSHFTLAQCVMGSLQIKNGFEQKQRWVN